MKNLPEKDVPEVWRRLADASTRRLVRAEARNLVAMRSEARAVHAELLGHLSATGTRSGALSALKAATTRMGDALSAEIVRARSRARDAALEQARAELGRLAEELRREGYREGLRFGELSKDPSDDGAHADAVGRSFAGRWAQAVLATIVLAEGDEDPRVAFRARLVMHQLDRRIAVVAATETSKAYNAQRDDAVEEGLGEDRRRRWFPLVFKRWSAVLDRRTCAACRDLDGALATPWGEFPGHEDDPPLHVSCRCVAHLVFLPLPLSERGEDDADEEEGDEEEVA